MTADSFFMKHMSPRIVAIHFIEWCRLFAYRQHIRSFIVHRHASLLHRYFSEWKHARRIRRRTRRFEHALINDRLKKRLAMTFSSWRALTRSRVLDGGRNGEDRMRLSTMKEVKQDSMKLRFRMTGPSMNSHHRRFPTETKELKVESLY
jgi:hypothetical protein